MSIEYIKRQQNAVHIISKLTPSVFAKLLKFDLNADRNVDRLIANFDSDEASSNRRFTRIKVVCIKYGTVNVINRQMVKSAVTP